MTVEAFIALSIVAGGMIGYVFGYNSGYLAGKSWLQETDDE